MEGVEGEGAKQLAHASVRACCQSSVGVLPDIQLYSTSVMIAPMAAVATFAVRLIRYGTVLKG